MRNVPSKIAGDTYTSQELNEGTLNEDKHIITDTLQNFDSTSVSQKMQAIILAAGNRLTYIEDTGSTGAAYKVKNLQSTSDQAKFIQDGFKFTLIFTNTNTVPNPTIEFHGIIGTYNIVDNNNNPLKLNIFKLNSFVEFVYNGTNFVVASILTSQEDINKNNFYSSTYTSPNYLLTNNIVNPTSYYNGMVINFVSNSKSNAPVKLKIGSLTAISLINDNGEVSYNDILLNSLVSAIYYSGNFYLLKIKNNIIVNSNNTYSAFDNSNVNRRSAFNIGGLATYSSNVNLSPLQSHQKIKINNTSNSVQITLPAWSTCDDNCEYPIMIESSDNAVSFAAYNNEFIAYNGIIQSSISLIVDNGSFIIKKDTINNTWFVSGYSQSNGAVVGSIIQNLTGIIPVGYLYLDGSLVSRTQYAKLFAAIGISFGAGDGLTTFKIPDFRGCVMKGAGSVNSAPIGQQQSDAIRNIIGSISHVAHDSGSGIITTGAFSLGAIESTAARATGSGDSRLINFNASTVVPTANENRVKNYSVYFFIKY